MYARWGTFALGLWLVLAPLLVGYATLSPILQHVALGLAICIVSLAAMEWPLLRFALLALAAWLVGSLPEDPAAATVAAVTGWTLVSVAWIPGRPLRAPVADSARV